MEDREGVIEMSVHVHPSGIPPSSAEISANFERRSAKWVPPSTVWRWCRQYHEQVEKVMAGDRDASMHLIAEPGRSSGR